MIKLYTEQITQLLEMAEQQEVELSELEIINFICTFEKIIKAIVLSNQEYQLRLSKQHKLQAKFKRYHGNEQLIINVKRNRN